MIGSLVILAATWVSTVTHPVKDDATLQMLHDASREPDPVVQETAGAALESIRSGILTNQPPAPPPWPASIADHPAIDLRGLDADQARQRSEEVTDLLSHRETIVREEALAAVARGRLVTALPRVLPLLADADEGVRLAACEALAVLGPALETPATVIEPVVARLDVEPSFQVGEHAVAILTAMPQPAAIDALLALLKHERSTVRLIAARAVAAHGNREHAPVLHPLLRDTDDNVAAAAAAGLGRLGNPASRPPLLARLKENPPDIVQEQVAWALGELNAAAAVAALMPLVGVGNDKVSAAAAAALGKIGDPAAIPALRQPLEKINPSMSGTRRECLKALRLLGETETMRAAWRILVDRIIPVPMMEPMHDASDTREEALRYLVATGDPRIAGSLVKVIRESESTTFYDVMSEMFRSIGALGDAATAAALLEALKFTPPEDSRPVLVAVLGKLTGRRYRPLPNQVYRRYFLESLGPTAYRREPLPPGIELVE